LTTRGTRVTFRFYELPRGSRFAWPVTAVAQCVPSVDVSIVHVIVLSAVKCCTMRVSTRVRP